MSRRRVKAKQHRLDLSGLIDARDEIFVAKNLMVAAFMAAQASAEGSALCAVINAARETLEMALDRLDEVIETAR